MKRITFLIIAVILISMLSLAVFATETEAADEPASAATVVIDSATIPFIVTLCAFLCQQLKRTSFRPELLPLVSAAIGGAIGVGCFFIAPQYILIANDWTAALIIGVASGLAATGAHQIIKQSSKGEKR